MFCLFFLKKGPSICFKIRIVCFCSNNQHLLGDASYQDNTFCDHNSTWILTIPATELLEDVHGSDCQVEVEENMLNGWLLSAIEPI